MELIDYNLEKDIQTFRAIQKARAEAGRPTKHLFRIRSAEEVSRPYTKTGTWKTMARQQIQDPKLWAEFTETFSKTPPPLTHET